MTKKASAKKSKSMEEQLWDAANKLRGTVESSEYKHVVLGLSSSSLQVISSRKDDKS